MSNIEHIFFDLDHTLWDFDKNSAEALNEIYGEKLQHHPIPSFERFIKKYREINNRYWGLYRQNKVTKNQVRSGRFVDTLDFFKIKNSKQIGEEISEHYVQLSPTKTNLFPNTHQTLQRLNQKYTLHIITNGFVEVQHIKLDRSNLKPYFDIVVCSEETGEKKPHQAVFNLALEKAKTSPDKSVMIGDNLEADIHGAKKVGMEAIWFNPNNLTTKKNIQQIQDLAELSTIFNV
ncbi:MAG: YjjG family noncanonical pyrimidine nucleotidase [Putridiphycobacter sp.]